MKLPVPIAVLTRIGEVHIEGATMVDIKPAGIAAETGTLVGENLVRHRLAPDFSSDASKWSSKTGTLLNLGHEVGVVEHDDGSVFAVAALTESEVPAAIQPAAEAVIGEVARGLHDQLGNR
jgi:beta-lactamase class A